MNELTPFSTQQVRDLAWACFSQPLIFAGELDAAAALTDASFALTHSRRAWLEGLDRSPQPLLQHLANRRSHRLGIYFESLWQFFLGEDPAFELLAHNLPIHHEGRTLGEFDCLYFCHDRQQVVHLELAVKFFLGLRARQASNDGRGDPPQTSEAKHWLGPDAKDRLDLKLAHLLQRQTRLSDTPAAREALSALNIEVGCKEVAFKGYLFTHSTQPMLPPPAFNPACNLGHWMTCSEVTHALETGDTQSGTGAEGTAYTVLPKMQWLGPAQANAATQLLGRAELTTRIQAHFAQEDYPLMIAAMDAFGVEKTRFFVTHNRWPGAPGA